MDATKPIDASLSRFRVEVPESALDDLRDRLARTRFSEDLDNEEWEYGFPTDYLRELVEFWGTEYDWRATESRINAFENFRAEVEGMPIHFILRRGEGPDPMPIVLLHGWPWTFWDLQKVIEPLADPVSFGRPAEESFDVVVPSLPGFAFSSPLRRSGINNWNAASVIRGLMTEVLGYGRYAAAGGDIGSIIAAQMGHAYAEDLIGLYTHLPLPLGGYPNAPDAVPGLAYDPAAPAFPAPKEYAPEEQGWHQKNMAFLGEEFAYAALQRTKPQTLANALSDSPAGLISWLSEKRRAWADTGGEGVESVFDKADLCDMASIYWFTNTYWTSARYYKNRLRIKWEPAHDRFPVVEAPVAASVFTNDVLCLPRRWTERYFNLQQYRVHERGGHFAPFEKPEIYVDDIGSFFNTFR